MEIFLQCVISGIALGSVYGLVALGYSVIFSTMRMGHFAQGDFYMVGAYLAFQALARWSKPLWVAVLLSVVGTSLLMLVIERLIYRPMYTGAGTGLLIATMGTQYIIQEVAVLIWGSEVRKIQPFISVKSVSYKFLGMKLVISVENLAFIAICSTLMIILALFMKYTKMGQAMSAVSMNRDAAQLMGIKLTTVIATTYIMAASLAAVSGMLLGPKYSVVYTMGGMTGNRAMTAAVLGGFGNMPGAMLGGMLLGIIEITGAFYISSAYRDAFTFLVLILVLFWRPQGILGRRVITKV